LELTDALETLRKQKRDIFAFLLKAERQDIGEILEQAGKFDYRSFIATQWGMKENDAFLYSRIGSNEKNSKESRRLKMQ